MLEQFTDMLLEIFKAGTRRGNGKTSVDEIETTCVTTYLFNNKVLETVNIKLSL